jgi:hypothetical protein
MRHRHRSPIEALRLTIDCLPVRTREAMLEGVRANPVIVGAYTDGDGGVCPMLAAHRLGGRTDFISFAMAWDRYTGARPGRPARATRRQVRTLIAHLEMSLVDAAPVAPLQAAIAEHQASARRRRAREARATGLRWLVDPLGRDERPAAGRQEHDLGDDAPRRELEQHAHALGQV